MNFLLPELSFFFIQLREWRISEQGDQIFFHDAFSGETLYMLHILQIFWVLFPTSDLTKSVLHSFLCVWKPHTMQNYCGKFFTQFELSFPSFNYLNWVYFNFLTLNLYFNRGKKLSHQSQQNLYYLSEALATCFGLIMPLSGHCTRQISGIM